MKVIAIVLLFLSVSVSAQMTKRDSLWLPLAPFIGEWEGKGGGETGPGTYTRSYSYILDKRYIEVKNRAVYPPTEKKPDEEVHEDIGYISYDRFRKRFVLRQFHAEGFVNQYVLDSLSSDGRALVFFSEAIENIPPGWLAKESYQFVTEKDFKETFELSAPGKPFEVYSRVDFRRKK